MSDVNQQTCKHGACYNRDYTLEGVTLGAPFPLVMAEKAMTFPFTSQDILVASYPSSGEAFFYEVVWLLMNEADTESATNIPLSKRLPLLELTGLEGEESEPVLEKLHLEEGPRVMGTHLPYSLLGEAVEKGRPRLVVVMRDPKDLILSLYSTYRRWPGRELPSFTYFFETFVKTNRLMFGNHVDHLLGYWQHAKELNMLVMKYDEMINNVEDSVLKISNYIEKDLTPKQIHSIVKFMSCKELERKGHMNQMVDTILGVRLFEREISAVEAKNEDAEEEEEEEKGKTESTEVEIPQSNEIVEATIEEEDSEDVQWWNNMSGNIPPMEVEFVCVPKQLRLSQEQEDFIEEQCKAQLQPAGLTF